MQCETTSYCDLMNGGSNTDDDTEDGNNHSLDCMLYHVDDGGEVTIARYVPRTADTARSLYDDIRLHRKNKGEVSYMQNLVRKFLALPHRGRGAKIDKKLFAFVGEQPLTEQDKYQNTLAKKRANRQLNGGICKKQR